MSNWDSPTKRRKKLRMLCASKVAYFSADEAQVSIEEVRAAGKLRCQDAKAYTCTICGLYHWGNRPYVAPKDRALKDAKERKE